MKPVIDPSGAIRCLYGEAVDLAALGSLRVERASHVEPDAHGRWTADLSPVGGPLVPLVPSLPLTRTRVLRSS